MTLTEACRRDAEGWLSWIDSDIREIERLREMWAIGRRVRNDIVERRASGQPIDELVTVLRRVRKLCDEQLENWQPTPAQRQRAN